VHLKPKAFPDFKLYHSVCYPIQAYHTHQLPLGPSTFLQAITKIELCGAMRNEFCALMKNQTRTLCPRPRHHNVVQNKWVFKIKQKPDGSVDRYKARLVAKGFDQKSRIDYLETFNLDIKSATIHLVLALAINFS
jgi:hypothetical protein